MVKIIGLDPGLRHTGWGVITKNGNNLQHIAHGRITPNVEASISVRLHEIFVALYEVFTQHKPDYAAIEETFVNKNPSTTLKLGLARGVVMMMPSCFQVPVYEYKPNKIKKTVVGVGHAEKQQIEAMVKLLLNLQHIDSFDAADALAIAICHGQNMNPVTLYQY